MRDIVVATRKDCIYPNWKGGYILEDHIWDRDGWCIICGAKRLKEKARRTMGDDQFGDGHPW